MELHNFVCIFCAESEFAVLENFYRVIWTKFMAEIQLKFQSILYMNVMYVFTSIFKAKLEDFYRNYFKRHILAEIWSLNLVKSCIFQLLGVWNNNWPIRQFMVIGAC